MGGGSVSAGVIYILRRKRLRAAVEVVRVAAFDPKRQLAAWESGYSEMLKISGLLE